MIEYYLFKITYLSYLPFDGRNEQLLKNSLESSYSVSNFEPSTALAGREKLEEIDKISGHPEFINRLKSDLKLQKEYKELVDVLTQAVRTEISTAYEFGGATLDSNISKLDKIVGNYSLYGKEIPLEPVYPELWITPLYPRSTAAISSLEGAAVRSVVQFSPKALALMEKYPLMSELLTTTFVNTGYQVLGDRDYDPYALLKANLSTLLTRNQSLGKQVSANVMLSTLATENPNDYGWNALGAISGTVASYGVSKTNLRSKYGNLFLRPFLSGSAGEYFGEPDNIRDSFYKIKGDIKLPKEVSNEK